jgi:hypothetical protein
MMQQRVIIVYLYSMLIRIIQVLDWDEKVIHMGIIDEAN